VWRHVHRGSRVGIGPEPFGPALIGCSVKNRMVPLHTCKDDVEVTSLRFPRSSWMLAVLYEWSAEPGTLSPTPPVPLESIRGVRKLHYPIKMKATLSPIPLLPAGSTACCQECGMDGLSGRSATSRTETMQTICHT
jgi:hypothetical protein